jgi:SpoVK/Ycf46/Vps4 family AAA+-type ATPase
MGTLKDLELLINSRYPIIAAETSEEERIEEALKQTTTKLGIPLFVWTVTDGLRRLDTGNSIYDTKDPVKAYSGSSEADAGLSQRIYGRLLGWLQDRTAPVFVVATANQISQLPPELMRKGRFDEIFFIDLPNRDERKEILSVHLRKRKRDPSAFDLDALAEASEGFSGAEIEQAIVSALYTAFSRGTDLTTQLLIEELRATKPLSVTRKEEITALREWAQGRTVMAG